MRRRRGRKAEENEEECLHHGKWPHGITGDESRQNHFFAGTYITRAKSWFIEAARQLPKAHDFCGDEQTTVYRARGVCESPTGTFFRDWRLLTGGFNEAHWLEQKTSAPAAAQKRRRRACSLEVRDGSRGSTHGALEERRRAGMLLRPGRFRHEGGRAPTLEQNKPYAHHRPAERQQLPAVCCARTYTV